MDALILVHIPNKDLPPRVEGARERRIVAKKPSKPTLLGDNYT